MHSALSKRLSRRLDLPFSVGNKANPLCPGPFLVVGPYKVSGKVRSIKMVDWKKKCGVEFGIMMGGVMMNGVSSKGTLPMRDVFLYDKGERRPTGASGSAYQYRVRFDPADKDAEEDIDFTGVPSVFLVFRNEGSSGFMRMMRRLRKPNIEIQFANPLSPIPRATKECTK